ncbi:hypothetical protein P8605_19705 [Streptomyces sp. T-3]|nr:hypothetical protein [Streptomyces sp. T-3]
MWLMWMLRLHTSKDRYTGSYPPRAVAQFRPRRGVRRRAHGSTR